MRFEWLSGPGAASPELIHQENASGDTIALVFTGQELTDLVTDPGLHGELADWVPWAPEAAEHSFAGVPQPSDIAYINADHHALVIYGAPPSIDVTPANDDGHALSEFGYSTDLPFMLGRDADNIAESLSDYGLQGLGTTDALEALATLAPDAEANTFLLTNFNIADLVGDFDQAQVLGSPGEDALLLNQYLAEGLSVIEPFVPGGSIAIEIDDGSAAANTHILT